MKFFPAFLLITIILLSAGCVSPGIINGDPSVSSSSKQVLTSSPSPSQTQSFVIEATPYIDPNTKTTIRESVYMLPRTGMILKGREFSNGCGEFSVDNMDGSSDAIAIITSHGQKEPLIAVYIQNRTGYSFHNINDGNYDLFINFGNDWNRATQKFEHNSYYSKFTDPFEFKTTEKGCITWTVTLYKVVNGNAKEEILSEDNFPKL